MADPVERQQHATWWAGSGATGHCRRRPPRWATSRTAADAALCGTRDLLHPENALLAERARGAGWDDTFVDGPGMIHVYPLLPIPEAGCAHRQITEFLS